jgi:hypothetical protein
MIFMIMALEDLIEENEQDRKFNRRVWRMVIAAFVIAAIGMILGECTALPLSY